jgi:hypothetical protein
MSISGYLEKYMFNAKDISKSLAGKEGLIKDFVEYAFSNEKDAWKASWVLSSYSKVHPEDLDIYTDKIISEIKKLKVEGHIRETLKILLNLNLNENQTSEVFDYCISLIEDNKRQASVRSISFQFLIKVAEKYPELKNEILIIFDNVKDFLSDGIKHSIEIRLFKQ